ncbi:MAG: hypothetical protein ACI92O_002702 [Colwellia sp.]|jgi:hypothetical protein|tara:strand:+ start:1817 stop:2353 length:537 start_codon:yes stop_codon:yes gene_type:complete
MTSKNSKKKASDFKIDTINNEAPSIGHYTGPAVDNFNWIAAIDAWDYCDPIPLGEMITNHNLPIELRPIISSIINGKRKQKKIASSKLKLAPEERLLVASVIICFRSIPEDVISRKNSRDYFDIANELGVEPIELLNQYRKSLKELDQDFVNITGLSLSSIQNLTLDLKNKLNNYPKI